MRFRDTQAAGVPEGEAFLDLFGAGPLVQDHDQLEADLALVVGAGGLVGLALGFGKSGEQEAGEDRNDRDDDEQLDEGEGSKLGSE